MSRSLALAGIIPDSHIPFHSERRLELLFSVLQYAHKHVSPVKYVLVQGDFGDFYSVMSHMRDPQHVGMLLEEEVLTVNRMLNRIDSEFPRAIKYFTQGNHEYRFERYIQTKAPELFGMVSVDKLFQMHRRKRWRWVPYGPEQRVRIGKSNLYARHEPLGGGENSARLTVKKGLCSMTFGHTHRIDMAQVTSFNGETHYSFSCGWLGDKEKYPEVFGYVKGIAQWAAGFGLVWIDEDTGEFWPHIIPILDDSCVVFGKRFRA